jgi:trehalose synthase
MDDLEENAAIVNALQRQATVIVQKCLAEGFGLTVAEAMWKAKPMVAAGVGGIQDQLTHEREGLLIDDPADLDAFAAALRRLLADRHLARRLGQAARQRVPENFLDDRQVAQSADLFDTVLADDGASRTSLERGSQRRRNTAGITE